MRTAALLTFAFIAAGCHRNGSPINGGGPDLAVGDATDMGGGDASDLAGSDTVDMTGSGGPDMTPPFAGDFRSYGGTTVDGWAAVVDGAGTAWAIKLADGTKSRIADHARTASATLDVIFVQHDVNTGGVGPLELWHKDGPGVHLADPVVDTFGVAPPLSDGAGHVTYYTWVGPGIAQLVLDTVDHATSRMLPLAAQDVDFGGPCTPTARFFAGRLLVQHCAYPATTKTVLTSYDVAGTADVDLATDAAGFSVAKDVGVLVTSTSGALNLVAADGSGTPTPIIADARNARFTADGSAAIVVTKAHALERVAMSDHAVTTLQPSGVLRLDVVSNDGSFATYALAYDSNSYLYDLWMSDARTAGTTAVALDPATTTASYGYNFTDDSAFAIYLVDYDSDKRIGSLRARPVHGGAERTIAAGSDWVQPITGSRIAYTENETGTYPDIRADISVVDLASGAASTKIATQAYYNFDVLSDGVTLVYVQPGEGLHVAKLP
ncbi:MAG: hypothetical protein ACXVDD_27740 [Polyangia bacterium]